MWSGTYGLLRSLWLGDDGAYLAINQSLRFIQMTGNLTQEVYPTLEGTGVNFFEKGGDIKVLSIKRWEIMPSNPY